MTSQTSGVNVKGSHGSVRLPPSSHASEGPSHVTQTGSVRHVQLLASDTCISYTQSLTKQVGRGHSFARSWSRHVHHLDSDIFSEAAIKDVTAKLDSPGAGFPYGVQSDIHDPSQNKANADELVFSKQRQNRKKREKSKGLNLRSKMGFFNLVRHDFLVWWDRFSSRLWEVPVFRDVINKTESHFGSSVVSVFIFTKWIFCLNLTLFLLWFFFVILPSMIYFPYKDVSQKFRFSNLLDGKGILAESFFFYGHYPRTINGYHLDFAYLLILLITYFGSFFIILRGIARATCLTVRGEDNTRLKFTTLLFATWDYNLTSRGAVYQASQSIINTCKDQMVEAKAHAAVFLRSRTEKTKVILLRILAWTITIILIGAGCAGIFFLVVNVNFADANHLGQISNATGINLSSGFFQVYGTTIIFSLINIIVPMAITRLPIMEHYSTGQWELRVTLVRVFFLRMANLIALMYSLYSTVQHLVDDSQTGDSSLGCVGTVLGQELYKLVIMDTLVHAIVNLSMYFGAYFWNRQKKELHLPSAILVIIYRQALIWAGTLACPVMPLIGLLSNSVFIGVNYLIVHRTCKPPEKRWNQSRHSAFFLRFLLFSLIILLPAVSYVLGSDALKLGKAPQGVPNGPFGMGQPTAAFSRWRKCLPLFLQECFMWILSDVVLLPAFLIMLVIILYLRLRVAYTYKQTIYLRADLRQEREDNKSMAKRLRFAQQVNHMRSPDFQ
ncbi:transmembrane channel-like protein 7 isoform X2 [Liolophura sinensis]